MCTRPEIPFDDMLASLWSQAYSEIISIFKENRLECVKVFFDKPMYDVFGITVANDVVYFINKYGDLKNAEDFPDEVLFGGYHALYIALTKYEDAAANYLQPHFKTT